MLCKWLRKLTGRKDMEYDLQPSPVLRTAKTVYDGGVFGQWTPTLTFATPGNLSVGYSQQSGVYVRLGNMIFVSGTVNASTWSHTTALGALRINGLPYAAVNDASFFCTGSIDYSGLNASTHNYAIVYAVANNSRCQVRLLNVDGLDIDEDVDNTHATSGTAQQISFSLWYVASSVT